MAPAPTPCRRTAGGQGAPHGSPGGSQAPEGGLQTLELDCGLEPCPLLSLVGDGKPVAPPPRTGACYATGGDTLAGHAHSPAGPGAGGSQRDLCPGVSGAGVGLAPRTCGLSGQNQHRAEATRAPTPESRGVGTVLAVAADPTTGTPTKRTHSTHGTRGPHAGQKDHRLPHLPIFSFPRKRREPLLFVRAKEIKCFL